MVLADKPKEVKTAVDVDVSAGINLNV